MAIVMNIFECKCWWRILSGIKVSKVSAQLRNKQFLWRRLVVCNSKINFLLSQEIFQITNIKTFHKNVKPYTSHSLFIPQH